MTTRGWKLGRWGQGEFGVGKLWGLIALGSVMESWDLSLGGETAKRSKLLDTYLIPEDSSIRTRCYQPHSNLFPSFVHRDTLPRLARSTGVDLELGR